jgi:hypothetical protein
MQIYSSILRTFLTSCFPYRVHSPSRSTVFIPSNLTQAFSSTMPASSKPTASGKPASNEFETGRRTYAQMVKRCSRLEVNLISCALLNIINALVVRQAAGEFDIVIGDPSKGTDFAKKVYPLVKDAISVLLRTVEDFHKKLEATNWSGNRSTFFAEMIALAQLGAPYGHCITGEIKSNLRTNCRNQQWFKITASNCSVRDLFTALNLSIQNLSNGLGMDEANGHTVAFLLAQKTHRSPVLDLIGDLLKNLTTITNDDGPVRKFKKAWSENCAPKTRRHSTRAPKATIARPEPASRPEHASLPEPASRFA